jgi:hypothetical protein
MDFSDKIARYEEIERRGLLSQLPQEKQDMWAEYKRRQAKDSAVNNDAENNGKQSYLEQMAGKVATLDRGLTFGLGRKALGLTWAAGSKLGDVIVGNDNAPDFWGRYHEFVDPVVEAQQKYAEEHPAEALTAEIAASIANPVNKVGAGFIGKGKSLADVAARASAVGGGVGGVAGAINTEYAKDLFPNTAAGVGVGAAMGGILPVAANRAGAVYNAIKRITAPEASVAGKATGLGNIVKDNESVRALSRGIMADDAVAAQVLQEAPTEMGRLNEELTDILNKTTGRKLNIEGAKQNADEAYKSYVAANADYPVYNTNTPQEQAADNFARWFEGSQVVDENGQPLKLYHQTGADFDVFEKGLDNAGKYDYETPSGFFFKSNNADIGLQGKKQIPVYIKGKKGISFKNRDEARKYFRENIEGYDDLLTKYNNVDNEYLAKDAQREAILDKRIDNLEKSPAYTNANEATQMKMREDVINSLDDDAFYNEWRDAGNKYASQMKNKINDYIKENNIDFMRLENDSGSIGKKATDAYIVFNPNQIKSVNNSGAWSSSPSLSDAGWKPQPSLKDVVGQLNEYKQNAMNKALAEGAAMSDYGAGSLDAVHKAQGVLNDMIENSFDKSVLGVKRPTTQTAELTSLKQVFNNMLEPSGVKPLDARIAKAKSLQYFYDMGYKFKPSEKKFEDLGIKTLRDKRAFLQGRLQAILDNVKDDKNLAKAIRADENTLKKLMPAKRFDELLSKTSEIDRQYTRLNKYIQLANRELDKPLAADRPMSERGESKLSYLGSLYDKANALMWQNANRRRAQALLNGGAQNPEVLAALERLAGRYNLGQITPYIAQLAAQNQ